MKLLLALLLASFVFALPAPPLTFDAFDEQRTLLFSNHPELIRRDGLTDAGASLYHAYDIRGLVRAWFEHISIAETKISVGAIVYNPSSIPVIIKQTGSGTTTKWDGAIPFVQLFTAGSAIQYKLGPHEYRFLVRIDNVIANFSCVTGVADFEVVSVDGAPTPPVEVSFVAFADEKTVRGTLPQLPYYNPNAPSADMLCYKGSSPVSDVRARNLDYTIDDSTPGGSLPVSYSTYNLNTKRFNPPAVKSQFTTHIGPSMNPEAVVTDEISLYTPGYGFIHVLSRCDGLGGYPNWGNWAVAYHLEGTIVNKGAKTRVFTYGLTTPGDSPIAYQNANGTWSDVILQQAERTPIYELPLPPGKSHFTVNYVLGGPGFGALVNDLMLL